MPGGKGGTDIYKCTLNDQTWSKPENLGEIINTIGDESTPFLYNNRILYFASNGHGGFGGLDVFKSSWTKNTPEVENMGYPINSAFDDFGLILNNDGTAGFVASNRAGGGFNDDLYQVVIDLQSYPLVISGYIHYNDPDWNQPDSLRVLPSAKIILVDNLTSLPVNETTTTRDGRFTLEIPYSSRYKLKVTSEKVGEPTVSLEIPKNKKNHTDYQIVVFKEKYKDAPVDSKTSVESPFKTGGQSRRNSR